MGSFDGGRCLGAQPSILYVARLNEHPGRYPVADFWSLCAHAWVWRELRYAIMTGLNRAWCWRARGLCALHKLPRSLQLG